LTTTITIHKKHKYIFIFLIFYLTAFSAYAEPEQRIIIYFTQALSEVDKSSIHLQLKILSPEYRLAEHSTDFRWIIILPGGYTPEELKTLKEKLLTNKIIKTIELDNLMEKKLFIQAQLLSL